MNSSNLDLANAQRQKIRSQILVVLYGYRPEPIAPKQVQTDLAKVHLDTTMEELQKQLDYLSDKGLILRGATYRLNAEGVDAVEGNTAPAPGLDASQLEEFIQATNAEICRRREIRWRVLMAIEMGSRRNVPEQIIWRVLEDSNLLSSNREVRRALTYLENKGLIRVDRQNRENWICELTAIAIDLVEYTVEPIPGIARPDKWW
jgi:hypothetical protein